MTSSPHTPGRTVVLLIFCSFALFYLLRHTSPRSGAGDGDRGRVSSLHDPQSLAESYPAYEEIIAGTQVLLLNTSRPKAVLLVFHGCSHSATDWWHPSSSCTSCRSLPEEVAVTKKALRKGWAVVAFSSSDRRHKCWDSSFPPHHSQDTKAVVSAFDTLSRREGWQRVPKYAIGGSSGGAFALHLALRLPLQGLCIQLMAVPSENLLLPKGWAFPPTAFVHMERDQRTADGVKANAEALHAQGVKVKEWAIRAMAWTESFMDERVDAFGAEQSLAVFKALQEGGALDQSGFLITDPRVSRLNPDVKLVTFLPRAKRRAVPAGSTCTVLPSKITKCWASRPHMSKSSWQSLVREQLPDLPVEADESALAEELNVAWAMHELVSDPMDEVFDWLERAAAGKV